MKFKTTKKKRLSMSTFWLLVMMMMWNWIRVTVHLTSSSQKCFHRLMSRLIEDQIGHSRNERVLEFKLDAEFNFAQLLLSVWVSELVCWAQFGIAPFSFKVVGVANVCESPFGRKIAKQGSASTSSSNQVWSLKGDLARVRF